MFSFVPYALSFKIFYCAFISYLGKAIAKKNAMDSFPWHLTLTAGVMGRITPPMPVYCSSLWADIYNLPPPINI